MTSQIYFEQTETAVRQLFIARNYYIERLKDIIPSIFVTGEPDEIKREEAFKDWHESNKETIERSLREQQEYFGLTMSNATICGSIVQIAFMGIKSFSKNSIIPPIFDKYISASKNGRQIFCVGKEVSGLPTGIIIYAARNQYNHMDEGSLNPLSTFVFKTLAEYQTGGKYKNPAFDLANSMLNNYSHNILALLEWNDYETYLADMKIMI
jgi:hypothetical protein